MVYTIFHLQKGWWLGDGVYNIVKYCCAHMTSKIDGL